MLARYGRLDGRHVDEQAAWAQGFRHAGTKQHLRHGRAVLQQAEGDVGLAGGIGCVAMHHGAVRRQRFCLGARAVPDMHRVPGLAQAPGHGQAHAANA